MTSASDVLDDAGYDFDDLGEPESSGSGPLRGSRGGSTAGETGTTRSSTGGAPRRTGRRVGVKRLEVLQRKLSGEVFTVGSMAGFAVPVTGMYICQESDAFTKAVVELASKRSEWVTALENIADIQPGLVVGRTAFGIGAALAVDRKRAEPDSRIMMALGVYQAWKSINDKIEPGEAGHASSYREPPVRVTVT